MNKYKKFTIRKLTIGVVSVCLGTVIVSNDISIKNNYNNEAKAESVALSGEVLLIDGNRYISLEVTKELKNVYCKVIDNNGENYTFNYSKLSPGENKLLIKVDDYINYKKNLPKTSVKKEEISFQGYGLSVTVTYEVDEVSSGQDIFSKNTEVKKNEILENKEETTTKPVGEESKPTDEVTSSSTQPSESGETEISEPTPTENEGTTNAEQTSPNTTTNAETSTPNGSQETGSTEIQPQPDTTSSEEVNNSGSGEPTGETSQPSENPSGSSEQIQPVGEESKPTDEATSSSTQLSESGETEISEPTPTENEGTTNAEQTSPSTTPTQSNPAEEVGNADTQPDTTSSEEVNNLGSSEPTGEVSQSSENPNGSSEQTEPVREENKPSENAEPTAPNTQTGESEEETTQQSPADNQGTESGEQTSPSGTENSETGEVSGNGDSTSNEEPTSSTTTPPQSNPIEEVGSTDTQPKPDTTSSEEENTGSSEPTGEVSQPSENPSGSSEQTQPVGEENKPSGNVEPTAPNTQPSGEAETTKQEEGTKLEENKEESAQETGTSETNPTDNQVTSEIEKPNTEPTAPSEEKPSDSQGTQSGEQTSSSTSENADQNPSGEGTPQSNPTEEVGSADTQQPDTTSGGEGNTGSNEPTGETSQPSENPSGNSEQTEPVGEENKPSDNAETTTPDTASSGSEEEIAQQSPTDSQETQSGEPTAPSTNENADQNTSGEGTPQSNPTEEVGSTDAQQQPDTSPSGSEEETTQQSPTDSQGTVSGNGDSTSNEEPTSSSTAPTQSNPAEEVGNADTQPQPDTTPSEEVNNSGSGEPAGEVAQPSENAETTAPNTQTGESEEETTQQSPADSQGTESGEQTLPSGTENSETGEVSGNGDSTPNEEPTSPSTTPTQSNPAEEVGNADTQPKPDTTSSGEENTGSSEPTGEVVQPSENPSGSSEQTEPVGEESKPSENAETTAPSEETSTDSQGTVSGEQTSPSGTENSETGTVSGNGDSTVNEEPTSSSTAPTQSNPAEEVGNADTQPQPDTTPSEEVNNSGSGEPAGEVAQPSENPNGSSEQSEPVREENKPSVNETTEQNPSEEAVTETTQPSGGSDVTSNEETSSGETPSSNANEETQTNETANENNGETCSLQASEETCNENNKDTNTSVEENQENTSADIKEFEIIDEKVKPFLRVTGNTTHNKLFTDIHSTKVTYEIKDPNNLFVKAVAKLYVNDEFIKEVTITDKEKLEARFGDLKPNIDYHIRTDVFYRNAENIDETYTIYDEVYVDFEKRDLEIKNIDEVELWRVSSDRHTRKLTLTHAPIDLDKYYVTLKSDEHKDIKLPVKNVTMVEKEGKTYFQFEATLMNLISKQESNSNYSKNIRFYIPKETQTNNTYSSFSNLLNAMKQNQFQTFTLTQDLSASDTNPVDGYYLNTFFGTLNGNGYTIHDLKAPLFNNLKGTVTNLNLSDVEIYQPNKDKVGALAKETNQSARVENVAANGTILANKNIGGLVGEALNTTLTNVNFKGTITSIEKSQQTNVGGISGWLGTSTIEKGYADISIAAASSNLKLGGLVGQLENSNTKIISSYAKGNIYYPISNNAEVGGLVGAIINGENIKIQNSITAVNVGVGNKVYGSSDRVDERFENIFSVSNQAIGQNNQIANEIDEETAKTKLETLSIGTIINQKQSTINKYDVDYANEKYAKKDRLLAYENMEKLLPFFTRDVIIQYGNRLNNNDNLVNKKLVDVVPISKDDAPLFDVMGFEEQGNNVRKVDNLKKVLLHFEDGTTEYQHIRKKNKDINSGAVVEYQLIDKNISYTPEVLISNMPYKLLVRELADALKTVSSSDINNTLGISSNNRSELQLEESINKIKQHSEKHISELISNYDLIGLDSDVARKQLKNFVLNNKARLLIGLAYMDKWYNIDYSNINAKDFMMKKADFFGKQVNSLDQLINIGGLGAEMLKPKNNIIVAGQIIGRESIDGDLFKYLEGYRKAFLPNVSNADWFNNNTAATIIETYSSISEVLEKQKTAAYSNRFYDKLSNDSWRHPEIALLLLNLPKEEPTMFVLTNMTSTAIGSYDKYKPKSAEELDFELDIMANRMAKHSDFWYNILPTKQKMDMFRNVITWDSFSNINGTKSKKHFYDPLDLKLNCQSDAGACSDYTDIYFKGFELIGEQGSTTYTHELVHVADKTYLLDYGRRNGLEPESYALGFLQSIRQSNQDTLGINSIYDFTNEFKQTPYKQLTNSKPDRFTSASDLQTYMRNYFDVLYTLDYLEAESVIKSSNAHAKANYFNKMEVKNDGTNVTQVTRVFDNNKTTIDELIDAGFVSRRSYDPTGMYSQTYQEVQNAYLVINAFNPIYGSLNNNGIQRNEYEFRKLAFELLAEYGYEKGFVAYSSNQYKNLADNENKAFADNEVIKLISDNHYNTSSEFRKAMFNRRKENLDRLREINIQSTNDGGYHHGGSQIISSIQDLRNLMDEAVRKDMVSGKYNSQESTTYSHTQSAVYSLKAAVLNGFLRATDEFRKSIYNNPIDQN